MSKKEDKIKDYNPDSVGAHNGNLFGLPFSVEECEVVILPVPWEATVSYRSGTAFGPQAILHASPQLDLLVSDIKDAWKIGIGMLPISQDWLELNIVSRKKATVCIEILENGGDPNNEGLVQLLRSVNDSCTALHQWVKNSTTEWLDKGKIVGVLGGEHSVALGIIQAMEEKYPSFGILQIDAHTDLRQGYEGFHFSHASIMYNVTQLTNVERLIQVGIRDYCKSEADYAKNSDGRIIIHEDKSIRQRIFEGENWKTICEDIISPLPTHVYISFDIDGLNPALCPNTGTPVPGGLSFEEAFYLIEKIVESGRIIIGFDLCEVSSGNSTVNEWDAIVGARVLYRLSNLTAKSQGRFEKN